jgi:endonuclease III
MRTPSYFSPLCLLQEFVRHQPWHLLVVCRLLSMSRATRVWPVATELFTAAPDPLAMLVADPGDIYDTLRPLGLAARRMRDILALSRVWVRYGFAVCTLHPGIPIPHGDVVGNLPGCGRYAVESYRIFIHPRILPEDPQDGYLRRYVEWARSASAGAASSAITPFPS